MKTSLLALFILICFAATSFPQSTPEDNQILATVGNHQITLKGFLDRYTDYLVYSGVQDNIELRFSILNNMINEVLLHNYDDNSKVISNPEYKKEILWAKNETILAFLKDQQVYSKITATDAEVRVALQRSKEKLAVRHLYAKTKKEADRLYKLLQEGASFNDLAKQVFTDTALKNNGGYLGYITWGDTDPAFEDAAYSLKVGEISKPVKTPEGYSIIKLDNKTVNPLLTEYEYDNMKHKIERGVKISKMMPFEKAYMKKVFGQNKIKFNDEIIQNVYNDLRHTNSGDPEFDNSSKDLSRICVEFEGKEYKQAEIERMLNEAPKYQLDKLTSIDKAKVSVHGLLMQQKLLSIAYEKGYDTTSYVIDTFKKLADYIYLNYKRNEIVDQITIPDSELYKFYNANIGYYKGENEMDVQEIILQDSAAIQLVKSKLLSGSNFGSLAKEYSLRKWSAKNEGEMGLSPVSKYGELKDTLWNSAIGRVIGPIKFDKYIGFFKVLKKEDGKPADFSVVKPLIIKELRSEKGFPIMKKHLDMLSKKVNIRVNKDLLKNYNINLAG